MNLRELSDILVGDFRARQQNRFCFRRISGPIRISKTLTGPEEVNPTLLTSTSGGSKRHASSPRMFDELSHQRYGSPVQLIRFERAIEI